MPVSEEQVWEVLRNCYDPEIPINIVDLGLIYEVKVEGDKVHVKMTLTAPGCPAHAFISENVRQQLMRLPGVSDASIEVVWDPPWHPSRMSEEAKRRLGMG